MTLLFPPSRKPLRRELKTQYTVVALFLAVNRLQVFWGGWPLYTLRERQLRIRTLAKRRTWLGMGHRLFITSLVYLRIRSLGLVVRRTSRQPQARLSNPVFGMPPPPPRKVLK